MYETVLAGRLAALGYAVARHRAVDIAFEGQWFEAAFRVDLLVDERLVVEIKSVERLTGAPMKQVLTLLGLLRQPVGLLLDFGGETLKEGAGGSSTITAPPRLRAFA